MAYANKAIIFAERTISLPQNVYLSFQKDLKILPSFPKLFCLEACELPSFYVFWGG